MFFLRLWFTDIVSQRLKVENIARLSEKSVPIQESDRKIDMKMQLLCSIDKKRRYDFVMEKHHF
jgi:hypothetical protein